MGAVDVNRPLRVILARPLRVILARPLRVILARAEDDTEAEDEDG